MQFDVASGSKWIIVGKFGQYCDLLFAWFIWCLSVFTFSNVLNNVQIK